MENANVKANETKVVKVAKVKKQSKPITNGNESKKVIPNKEKVVAKVKKQAEVNLIQEVITKREVKYIYPEGCDNTLDRKKHRQSVRNTLHRLELEMHRIKDKSSKEFKAKEKEYKAFRAKNLKEGAVA